MAKVTPSFKLYLYQLLSREIGYGKQTLLPQVEEVLNADEILCEDLECDNIQELVEACPEFLKVTTFKKGRVFATVLRNDEWDAMLAAPAEKPAADKGAKAGGMKSWKKNKKKGGQKNIKPVKPGKKRRDREAAEAEARAAAEAEAAAAAEAEAAAAAEAEAAAAAEAAAEEATEAEIAAKGAETAVATEAEATTKKVEAEQASVATETAGVTNKVDTVTVASETKNAAGATESVEGAVAETADGAAPATPSSAANAAEDIADSASATDEPAAEAKPAPKPAPTTGGGISLTITYDPYEDMERELERQRSEEATSSDEPQVEAPATQAAAAPATPAPSSPAQTDPNPTAPAPAPTPAPSPFIATAPAPSGLPLSFATEVSCKDAILRALYQLLPFEADPMAVLDEDWRVARSTSSLTGSRSRVTFPLRFQHEDGSPITITLRRTTRNASGRQWSLTLVDGDDGTGSSHDAIGYESLPTVDDGACGDLSGTPNGLELCPTRELAQQIVIGSWDAFLGSLAVMAAPERWTYPGEKADQQGRYGILRDYICTTFHRAYCQQIIATSPDGSFASFHTGLMTSLGDDIYACMTARKGDIPWQFEGFATVESGELGARLTGTLSPLPERATYLTSLECATLDPRRMIIIDHDSLLTKQLGRLPRAFLAEHLELCKDACAILEKGETLSSDDLTSLARAIRDDASATRRLRLAIDEAVEQTVRDAQASYRLVAPAYDPTENRTKLLLPLCLVNMGEADCALVLDLQPSGVYRAASILSLPRAYACARIISREQPRWLSTDRVLG